jgi:hypothetical protein
MKETLTMKKTDKNMVQTNADKAPSQNEDRTKSSDDEPLSRSDMFVITSMLAGARRPPLNPDDEIGGSTLSGIMHCGSSQLYEDLKPKDLFEEIHVTHLLNMQKIASECFNQAEKNADYLKAREIGLRYALKATEKFIQLSERLQSHWATQNSMPLHERIAVPLTRNTIIKGATLRERMEWTRIARYLDLKPQDPFESIHAGLIVRTEKAAWDCYHEAKWKKDNLNAREMNYKYSIKATDLSARLFANFESYRTKQTGSMLHNKATAGHDSGKLDSNAGPDMVNGGVRRSNKENKTRVKVNGTGQHA